jgi:hypothetical protein
VGVALTSSNPFKTRPQLFHMFHIPNPPNVEILSGGYCHRIPNARYTWCESFGVALKWGVMVVQKAPAAFGRA